MISTFTNFGLLVWLKSNQRSDLLSLRIYNASRDKIFGIRVHIMEQFRPNTIQLQFYRIFFVNSKCRNRKVSL